MGRGTACSQPCLLHKDDRAVTTEANKNMIDFVGLAFLHNDPESKYSFRKYEENRSLIFSSNFDRELAKCMKI